MVCQLKVHEENDITNPWQVSEVKTFPKRQHVNCHLTYHTDNIDHHYDVVDTHAHKSAKTSTLLSEEMLSQFHDR